MAALTGRQKQKGKGRLPADTTTALSNKQVGIIRSLAGAKPPISTIAALTTKQRRRLRARVGGPLL